MKKFTIFALVCAMCLSVASCGKDDGKAETTATAESSAVVTETKETEPAEKDDGEAKEIPDQLEYDDAGRIVKRTLKDPRGHRFNYYTTYEYDDKGNLSCATEYDNKNVCLQLTMYEYHENGVKSKETRRGPGGNILSSTEYSATGLKLKEETFDNKYIPMTKGEYEYYENGKIKSEKLSYISIGRYEERTYGEDGNMLSFTVRDKDGNITEMYTYVYDENGRKEKELVYSPEEVIVEQIVYYYDADGNVTETKKFDPDGYEIVETE